MTKRTIKLDARERRWLTFELPEIGPIEDVHVLCAIHEGLKRVSTPEVPR